MTQADAGTPGTEGPAEVTFSLVVVNSLAQQLGTATINLLLSQEQVQHGLAREQELSQALAEAQAESQLTIRELRTQVEAQGRELDILRARVRELDPPPQDTGPTVVPEGVRRSLGRHGAVPLEPHVLVPDDETRTFQLQQTVDAEALHVFWNGSRLLAGTENDYIVQGRMLTLRTAPRVGDVLSVEYPPAAVSP